MRNPVTLRIISGESKPNHSKEYLLALKHRTIATQLIQRTPIWQIRKLRRRWKMWSDAMGRFHRYGQDKITTPEE